MRFKMMNDKIYLIGMMGSGKSTIGQMLADRLHMPWCDLDKIVEKKGMTIKEIFEAHGEAHFRKLESGTLCDLASGEKQVVSTGGGIVLSEENRQSMRESGHVFYLCARPETLIERLETKRADRPLIEQGNLQEKIQRIYEARKDMYICAADYVVHTDGLSMEQVVGEIIEGLKVVKGRI